MPKSSERGSLALAVLLIVAFICLALATNRLHRNVLGENTVGPLPPVQVDNNQDGSNDPDIQNLQNEDSGVMNDIQNEVNNLDNGALFNFDTGNNNNASGSGRPTTKPVATKNQDGSSNISSNGTKARTLFVISINDQTGEMFISTPSGDKTIKILPDQVMSLIQKSGVQNQVDNIELKDNPTVSEPVFDVKGQKIGKIFGFIPFSAPVETQVGAQTGKIISTKQSFFTQLFSQFVK
jgi:hypothetical protein